MWPLPSPSIQHLSQMTQGCPLPSPIKPCSGPSQWADIPLKTLSRQDWRQAVSPSPAISTQRHPPSPAPTDHVSCSCCCSKGTEAPPPWPRFPCCSFDILWLRIQTVSIFMVLQKSTFSL